MELVQYLWVRRSVVGTIAEVYVLPPDRTYQPARAGEAEGGWVVKHWMPAGGLFGVRLKEGSPYILVPESEVIAVRVLPPVPDPADVIAGTTGPAPDAPTVVGD